MTSEHDGVPVSAGEPAARRSMLVVPVGRRRESGTSRMVLDPPRQEWVPPAVMASPRTSLTGLTRVPDDS